MDIVLANRRSCKKFGWELAHLPEMRMKVAKNNRRIAMRKLRKRDGFDG